MSTIWQPNTPATVDEDLNVSAPKTNNNFNTIGNGFAQDHNRLGSTINVGQHNQSTYITQSAVPIQDPNNIRLFAQIISSIPQIFAQYPTISTTGSPPLVVSQLIQLTNFCSPTVYTFGGLRQTEVSLNLNGIIIKIGVVQFPTTGSSFTTITFGSDNQPSPPTVRPASNPFPTSLFFVPVMPSGLSAGQTYQVQNSNIAGFQLQSSVTTNYCYIACGN